MRKQYLGPYLALSFGILAACSSLGGQTAPATPAQRSLATDSVAVHAAAHGFLAAFDSLQFEPFRNYFADDITMFFPFPQFPARINGKQEVGDVFGQFMSAQREGRAKAGQPAVMGITPRDLLVQMVTHDVAVVSFHLGSAETPARRSVIFRNSPAGWKVIHWHASSPPPQPASR